jgi:hypothetical protein
LDAEMMRSGIRVLILIMLVALVVLIIWAIAVIVGAAGTVAQINEPDPESVPLRKAAVLLERMNVPGRVRKIIYYNADSEDLIGVLDGGVDKIAFSNSMEKAGYTLTPPPGRVIDLCWTKPWKKDAFFVLLSHQRDWIIGLITQPAPRDSTSGAFGRMLRKWPLK